MEIIIQPTAEAATQIAAKLTASVIKASHAPTEHKAKAKKIRGLKKPESERKFFFMGGGVFVLGGKLCSLSSRRYLWPDVSWFHIYLRIGTSAVPDDKAAILETDDALPSRRKRRLRIRLTDSNLTLIVRLASMTQDRPVWFTFCNVFIV